MEARRASGEQTDGPSRPNSIAPSLYSRVSDDSTASAAVIHWNECEHRCQSRLDTDYEDVACISLDTVLDDGVPMLFDQVNDTSMLKERWKDFTAMFEPAIQCFKNLPTCVKHTSGFDPQKADLCAKMFCYVLATIFVHELSNILDSHTIIRQDIEHLYEEVQTFKDVVQTSGLEGSHHSPAVIETLADLLHLNLDLVEYFRRNQFRDRAMSNWGNMAIRINKLLERIERRKSRIKDLRETHGIPQIALPVRTLPITKESSSASRVGIQTERRKCHHMPTPKISNFFGRENQITNLHTALYHNDKDIRHRAACIWGTGGIGKTQLALEYAERQKDRLDYIFWIDSENQVEIDKSFSAIALKLSLPHANEEGNQAKNKFLVLDWLQNSDNDFLIIYDNVEDFSSIVKSCWPLTPHASLLVTARPEIVSMDMIEHSFEVPSFSKDESREFLLSIINQKQYSESDRVAAEKISDNLGGIPLAVTVMGMNIRTSRRSLPNFLPWYEKYTSNIHKKAQELTLHPYYPHNLDSSYGLSFERLQNSNNHAYELFRIICTISPENIPSSIFLLEDWSKLPQSISFCSDEWLYVALPSPLTLELSNNNAG
ncbi:P-loop containing nucleoside triphosphate hydrolase protein [Xylaria arbuscula]|nr:P-loop containing nucleoside triphosphate hydrolase protein [Xylaria arbuscula]